ncbi:MAG TPA: S8 family serine peptidase [Pyrinomonadaceae bacterium]|nr:S8 family serine peptidase [Pyrinomonadaceae bacterium]
MKSRKRVRIKLFCLLIIAGLVVMIFSSSPRSGAQVGGGTGTLTNWRAKVDARVLDSAAALGQTEFLIYMKQQADLSGARALATKNEKGQFVYDRLTSTAQATQINVKQALVQRGAQFKSFWISNTVWAQADLSVIQAVAMLPEVAAVYPIGKGALKLPPEEDASSRTESPSSPNMPLLLPSPEPGIMKVNADDVWALGYEGQGVVVAGADTGVRFTHNALRNQYRGWGGSAATSTHDYNWHDAIHVPNWPPEPANPCNPGGVTGAGQPSPVPCDDDVTLGGGHGSHTVGTMVGDDGSNNLIGMAPQAKWIACRNMSNGVGAIPTYLECMEWFIAPTDLNNMNPDTSKAPHVINNSWGCIEGCPPDPNPLRDTLKASRAAGIVYVASAGNDGTPGPAPGCNTIYHPLARYPEAFTVGATTHTTDLIADYSSRGPAAADPENPGSPLYIKPNVSAPGSTIRSALRASDTTYGNLSGTSMAGPHVAGLVALVISANPALAGNVDRIEEIIEQSAAKKTTTEGCGLDTTTQVPNNTYGWGRIDALDAVTLALEDVDTSLVNYALTTLGSIPSASSTYTTRNYSTDGAFDGERAGGGWEQGGGWNDATRDAWPDNLDITFGGGPKTISEIRVYTVQNDFRNPVVPDETTDASLYGIQDFEIQAFNGVLWVTVPGGTIIGNTKALRVITLNTPVTTTGIRIVVNMGRSHYSRIVELECYGTPGQ